MISLSRDDDEHEQELRQHLQRSKESWIHARIGLKTKIADDYRVSGAGHYFVVGPDGLAVAAKAKLDEIEAAVETALSSN